MEYKNTSKFEKLKMNENNTYFVLDFDKTITAKNSMDSWNVSGILLGEEYANEISKLFKKYRPIELNYQIKTEEKEKAMIEWYEKCMKLYHTYHLTKEKLIQEVKISNLVFRDGAKEFLQKATAKKIPIIILSAGIGNVIEQFLKENDCYYSNMYIISNFMEFDEQGHVKEFDNSKMIHTLNKTMKGKLPKEYNDKIKNRPYKILIGDLKEDENMIDSEQWDTTLKIGILENETPQTLKVYQKTFDIVLTGEDASFKYLNKIIIS